MNSKSGFNLERVVKNHLTDLEFNVEKDPDWEHIHKLDMVVTRFPGMPGIYPLGVQITERVEEHAKLEEFTSLNSGENRVTPKSLYIEIDPQAPMEKGGAQLIAAALFDYQFNKGMASKTVYGLRINRGLTYEFFDPQERLAMKASGLIAPKAVAPVVVAAPQPPVVIVPKEIQPPISSQQVNNLASSMKGVKPRLGGFIHTYFPARGYGMITSQDGSPYFLHIYSIVDLALREKLNGLHSVDGPTSVEETITFIDGGKTKADAKYPEAKDVRAA